MGSNRLTRRCCTLCKNDQKLNYGGKELRYYAGSPLIAAELLRPQDRALLTELHPSDYPILRNNFNDDKMSA